MTPHEWESAISCFPPKTRDAVRRVLLSASYALERHPGQPIGPQIIYDAWVELNREAEAGSLDVGRNELFRLKPSMGTVAQYTDFAVAYVESIRINLSQRHGDAPGGQEPLIEQALESTKAAIDRIAALIIEQRNRIETEAKSRFQAVLDQQLAASAAREQQLAKDKAAYLKVAAECRHFSERCDELQAQLGIAETERDAATRRGDLERQERAIHEARANALQEQITALRSAHDLLKDELLRERGRSEELKAEVARATELTADNATLRERLATAEALLVDAERRHERELGEDRRRSAEREARALATVIGVTSWNPNEEKRR